MKFLNQAFQLDQLIKSKQEELRELRERANSIPIPDWTKERVQGGERSDRVAKTVASIVDLERELQDDLDSYIQVKNEIRRVIDAVKKPKLKLILQMRYANYRSGKKFKMLWMFLICGICSAYITTH